MADTSKIKEHMDVISSDRKTVGKVDHLDGPDKIKLTKQSSPDGQHHHFIPVDWGDHVDQHVHLNKCGEDVSRHWSHGQCWRCIKQHHYNSNGSGASSPIGGWCPTTSARPRRAG